ncbi:MAG: hypothetical protein JWR38_4161 [Mucilaginibacter sp.]|nr:hypothetical protein [Mucilaginibacter sp.]
MKVNAKNILWLLLLAVTISGCSKKDLKYKDLVKGGEIYYPGVPANTNYRAGDLRTMLVWSPSPDPNITKYKIYWNNLQDSMIVSATSHNPKDTVKTIIPNLREATYNFIVYSIDNVGHVSIPLNINAVRVFGGVYRSGIFNRGYDASAPYNVDVIKGNVQLKFNAPDSVNVKTVINYIDNTGKTNSVVLRPDSNTITLNNFKFGTNVTYQSTYMPSSTAIDTFTVSQPSTFPNITRAGDVTRYFIKNAGYPFARGDNGSGKWGTPKDWQYNSNVLNQNGNTAGGWSTDGGGLIHFEAKDYSGDGVNNGKVYQTFTLPPGSYALDMETGGYNSSFKANEIVAIGTTLPDIDNLGNPLAIFRGDQNNMGGVHTLNFTLTQSTTVTIGWVVSTQSTTYLQFKGVKVRVL